MQRAQFSPALLHPRYWPTWFGFGLWWLLAQLPYQWQLKMGRALGWALYYLARRRRRIAERNITLCFPELSPDEQREMVRANIVSTAIAVFESGMAWFWPPGRLRKLFSVEGLEHLRAAEAAGQGVLLLAMHFTNLDIGGMLLRQVHAIDAMYRPHNNAVYDYLQRRGRERFEGTRLYPREDLRQIVKDLRAGRAIWYAPDQDYGQRSGVFAPFFGIPAATVTATAQIARLGKARVIPFVQTRQPQGGYVIKVFPPLDNFPAGDDLADATRINAIVEAHVRENPTQYMWVHRRFKTRPQGEPNLYD